MNTIEMVNSANKNGKTYKVGCMAYNIKLGFHDYHDKQEWPGSAFNTLNTFINEEGWKEVKQPVTWEEARAWMEESYIKNKAIHKGVKHYIEKKDGYLKLCTRDMLCTAFLCMDMLDGEWYIDD